MGAHRALPPSVARTAAASPTATAFALRRRRPHCGGMFGYTWVSFGLEVGSWLLLAIIRAARAAYTIVNWMLLGCAGGGVDTTELLKGGGSIRSRAGGVDSASLLDVAAFYSAGS